MGGKYRGNLKYIECLCLTLSKPRCLTVLTNCFFDQNKQQQINPTCAMQVNRHLKSRMAIAMKEKNTNKGQWFSLGKESEQYLRKVMLSSVITTCHWISYNSNMKPFTEVQVNIYKCLLDLHYGIVHCYINSMCLNWFSHPILYNCPES